MPQLNTNISPKKFHQTIFAWFDSHGRKHLPWQKNKTPYRVWISEIMLQQTQVSTVIPYFERFMQRFPQLSALADAKEDEVLHLWTGLGYYTRARNLHKTAKILKDVGDLPNELSALENLPGIGRSTAGAILSIAFQKPATILDGNVKRVLTRFNGITEWPGEKNTAELLWQIAEKYTPTERTADYSQAMMDLGAMICIRGKPLCTQCPLIKSCSAHQQGIEKTLPKSKPKKTLPIKKATLLIIQNKHGILLEKRPPSGIWGGLWTLPEIPEHVSQKEIRQFCTQHFNLQAKEIEFDTNFRHTFSHYHFEILPVRISVATASKVKVMDSEQQIWYNLHNSQTIGLPAPVKKLLRNMT